MRRGSCVRGKNGSGKTSVLEALAGNLSDGFRDKYFLIQKSDFASMRRARNKSQGLYGFCIFTESEAYLNEY